MKSIAIYYSMSGNTRKIAQAIRQGMGQVADQCHIVAIQGANGVPGMRPGHLAEYDLIGIGSPVWRGTITPNILNFINTMPSRELQFVYNNCYGRKFSPEEKQHCFFFLSHGKWPGAAVADFWKALETRGLTVIGWNDWYGDSVMSYAQKPWQTYGHPDDIDLKEAESFGRQMVVRSRKIAGGETNLIPELPTGEAYLALYGRSYDPNKYVAWIKHHYGLVTINKEKCTRCGLCELHCPMGAIDLEAESPVLPTCMWCTTCDMVCPADAIDINMAAVRKDRGATREEIHEKAQILQKLFEEGQRKLRPEKRMRWLVNPDDLWREGYIHDIVKSPRVVIPTQGWQQREKE
jgi:ferredoxin/flavodoxin